MPGKCLQPRAIKMSSDLDIVTNVAVVIFARELEIIVKEETHKVGEEVASAKRKIRRLQCTVYRY